MKYCTNCGHQLAEGAKFCDNCGTAVNAESSRKTVYEGEVHKCASCGEILKAFETVCPVCGNEVRGVKGSSCVKELSDKLESAKSEEQKIGIIKNFPIPNTKEDIYELFFLATSNFELDVYVRNISFEDQSDAWYALICRCYEAAKVCLKGQDEFAYIEEKYVALNQKINKAVLKYRRREKLKKNKVAIIIASSLLAVVMLICGLIHFSKKQIGCVESDMIGKSYTTIVNDLKDQGFSNIQTKPVYGADASKEDYLVLEVEIDGKRDYKSSTRKDEDVKIVVKYYIGFDLSSMVGKKYTDLEAELKNKGFEKIRINREAGNDKTRTDGIVTSIEVGGKKNFTALETLNPNTSIVINYYHYSFKVTLDANGGECNPKQIVVYRGECYESLPDATKEGYDFVGWYYKTQKVNATAFVKENNAHTLVAKYYKTKFSWSSSDGEEVVLSRGISHYDKIVTDFKLSELKELGKTKITVSGQFYYEIGKMCDQYFCLSADDKSPSENDVRWKKVDYDERTIQPCELSFEIQLADVFADENGYVVLFVHYMANDDLGGPWNGCEWTLLNRKLEITAK